MEKIVFTLFAVCVDHVHCVWAANLLHSCCISQLFLRSWTRRILQQRVMKGLRVLLVMVLHCDKIGVWCLLVMTAGELVGIRWWS